MSAQAEILSNLINGNIEGWGLEIVKETRKTAKHRKSVIIKQKVEKFNTMDSTLALEQNVHFYCMHCSCSADLRCQLPIVTTDVIFFLKSDWN